LLIVLLMSACTSSTLSLNCLKDYEEEKVLSTANQYLKEFPVTVTAFSSPRSAGGEHNFKGVMRPDHGRMIWGEKGKPGYGLYDRALGAMYIAGLWEGINKKD